MSQTRVLQKFTRFISLNAVLEKAEAYIASNPDDLVKFNKDLEEFKEAKVDADYVQFLNQQPKFKEFIQRQVIDRHARKFVGLLDERKASTDQISKFENEYKEFLGQPHADFDKDFLKFCEERYSFLNDWEKEKFKSEYDMEMHHLEHELNDLKVGGCFGFSITDALLKDWAVWEKKIKNWSGKYSELQPDKLSESKTASDVEDLRTIFSFAIPYVIPNQVNYTPPSQGSQVPARRGYYLYMPDMLYGARSRTLDFLRPQAHEIILPESKELKLPQEKLSRSFLEISVLNKETNKYEIKGIQKYKIMTGNFTFGHLCELLGEEFQKVIAGNICLVTGDICKNGRHACRLSYADGEFTLYDSNDEERISGDKFKIANAIRSKFGVSVVGSSIVLQVASFDSKRDLEVSAYDTLLRDSPHSLVKGNGLHFVAEFSPDTLLELFKRARTNDELSGSIATALTVLDKFDKSGFYRILVNFELFKELLELSRLNAQVNTQFIKAISELFESAHIFKDSYLLNVLSSALFVADSTGKKLIEYLLPNPAFEFSDLLRVISAHNQAWLSHAFYHEIIQLQDKGIFSFKEFVARAVHGDMYGLLESVKANMGIRCALIASLENEPDLARKLIDFSSEFQALLVAPAEMTRIYKRSTEGAGHLVNNRFKAAFDCFEEVLKTDSDDKTIQDEINYAQWSILRTVQAARNHAYQVVDQCNLAIRLTHDAVNLFKPPLIQPVQDFLKQDSSNLVATAESYFQYGYFKQAECCFSEALSQLDLLTKEKDVPEYKAYIAHLESRRDLAEKEANKRPSAVSSAGQFSSSPAVAEPDDEELSRAFDAAHPLRPKPKPGGTTESE